MAGPSSTVDPGSLLESLGGEKAKDPPPFILASNLPPILAKLVKKIQALEFVPMRELLQDNIQLSERLEALPRATYQQAHAQREVDSILTWAGAFLSYMAVVNEAHPEKTKGLIAYMRSLMGEARKNEAFNWRSYDEIFRKHAAADRDKDWSVLDHSLHVHAACLSGRLEKAACAASVRVRITQPLHVHFVLSSNHSPPGPLQAWGLSPEVAPPPPSPPRCWNPEFSTYACLGIGESAPFLGL